MVCEGGVTNKKPVFATSFDRVNVTMNVEDFLEASHYVTSFTESGFNTTTIEFPPAYERAFAENLPLLKPGFYASVDDPLSVFACKDTKVCPGGAAGLCAAGRTGIACGLCLDNHYAAADGSCQSCERYGTSNSATDESGVLVNGATIASTDSNNGSSTNRPGYGQSFFGTSVFGYGISAKGVGVFVLTPFFLLIIAIVWQRISITLSAINAARITFRLHAFGLLL